MKRVLVVLALSAPAWGCRTPTEGGRLPAPWSQPVDALNPPPARGQAPDPGGRADARSSPLSRKSIGF